MKTSLKAFVPLTLLTLVSVILLKVVELACAHQLQLLPNALTYNLVVTSWTLIGVGVLYCAIAFGSRKAAALTSGAILGVYLLSELGLTIYASHNGFLLGNELFSRPLSESIGTVVATMGWFLPLLIIVAFLGVLMLLAVYWSRHPQRWSLWWLLPIAIFSLLGIIFKMDHLKVDQHNSYILNKTYFCLGSSWDYLQMTQDELQSEGEEVPYLEDMIDSILLSHPEFNPTDKTFPLEREDNTEDILSPLFAESNTLPNIVILVVESMGNECMNSGMMPFVDSLAQTGLYWPNCISSTRRSFGAVPAITGSVGGPKGFQFGNMPQHNSLLSILQQGGYNTQAYYAGYFSFDCIYEYLTAQHINYLSPYFEEYQSDPDKSMSSYWGYHDNILFDKMAQHLNANPTTIPTASLAITITTHEALDLADKQLQKQYTNRARPVAAKTKYSPEICAAYLFADDAIRSFFASYSHNPQFDNTIFVLTGDHAMGIGNHFALEYHHVPLVIWSPMIERGRTFNHLVTHFDIAPSLYALLRNKYHLMVPPTVHWLGSGLGKSMPKTMVVVEYDRPGRKMLYHDLFYQPKTYENEESLHRIMPDFTFQEVKDPQLMETCRGELRRMNYLLKYTYQNDRLTQHPVFAPANTHCRMKVKSNDITVSVPNKKPSEASYSTYTMLESCNLVNSEGFDQAEVVLEADVKILKELAFTKYSNLTINHSGNTNIWSCENILKYLNLEKPIKGHTYPLRVVKQFPLDPSSPARLSISIQTPHQDEQWVPGDQLQLSHIAITVNYKQTQTTR